MVLVPVSCLACDVPSRAASHTRLRVWHGGQLLVVLFGDRPRLVTASASGLGAALPAHSDSEVLVLQQQEGRDGLGQSLLRAPSQAVPINGASSSSSAPSRGYLRSQSLDIPRMEPGNIIARRLALMRWAHRA